MVATGVGWPAGAGGRRRCSSWRAPALWTPAAAALGHRTNGAARPALWRPGRRNGAARTNGASVNRREGLNRETSGQRWGRGGRVNGKFPHLWPVPYDPCGFHWNLQSFHEELVSCFFIKPTSTRITRSYHQSSVCIVEKICCYNKDVFGMARTLENS